MKSVLLLPLIVAATLLTGCLTTTVEPLNPQQRASLTKVAVVAHFPDLAMQKTGTTVFNNTLFRVPDSAGETITEAIKITSNLLSKNDFDVLTLDDVNPDTWKVLELKTWSSGYDFSPEQLQILSDLEASGVDALVVVKGRASGDAIAGTNQILATHGLYHRSFLNIARSHAFIGLSIIVLSTADGSAIIRDHDSRSEEMPEIQFPADLEAMDPSLLEEVQASTLSQLRQAIPDLLARMGLTSAPSEDRD